MSLNKNKIAQLLDGQAELGRTLLLQRRDHENGQIRPGGLVVQHLDQWPEVDLAHLCAHDHKHSCT